MAITPPTKTAERVFKMQKANTKKQAPKKAQPVVFTHNGNVTGAQVWEFINFNAGGNMGNVSVVPLPNVNLTNPNNPPTPFGYQGKPNGTRAMYHNWLLKGLKGSNNLATITTAMVKHDGHSKRKLLCLTALLNGGYSPSSATWGTPFVQLVVNK